jgi:hypothetical protein
MGEFREYRSIIPGTLLVFMLGLTILVASNFATKVKYFLNATGTGTQTATGTGTQTTTGSQLIDILKVITPVLVAIIGLFISTLAGGYLCGTLTVTIFGTPGIPYGGWLKNIPLSKAYMRKKLVKALGISVEDRQHIAYSESTTEASLRFHSHAPDEVINFARRRLTAVYIALNSIWALVIGFIFGLLAIYILSKFSILGFNIPYIIILVILVILLIASLYWNAKQAAEEQWDFVCKFIEWDVETHRYPRGQNARGGN